MNVDDTLHILIANEVTDNVDMLGTLVKNRIGSNLDCTGIISNIEGVGRV